MLFNSTFFIRIFCHILMIFIVAFMTLFNILIFLWLVLLRMLYWLITFFVFFIYFFSLLSLISFSLLLHLSPFFFLLYFLASFIFPTELSILFFLLLINFQGIVYFRNSNEEGKHFNYFKYFYLILGQDKIVYLGNIDCVGI